MARFLNKTAHEQGAMLLNVLFKDERRRIIVPKTQAWQLMKLDRSVINTRTFESSVLAGWDSDKVVLSGDDLAIFGDDDTLFRIFAAKGTYDSTYGDDFPCVCEIEFVITRMLNIPDSI